MEPRHRQWIYNSQDGSIRFVFNGRCLSIDRYRTGPLAYIILDDCHINDSQALCQDKNQQWLIDTFNATIISQMSGLW